MHSVDPLADPQTYHLIMKSQECAVLGESLELCKDAAKWFAEEKIRLEKSRKANKEVMESIQPMVERNRQMLLKRKSQKE